jgi:LacI family transcriptional regulator
VRPPRLKDVAALAGVDPSTASRVLNGRSSGVRVETARRVLNASAQLDYRPNASARGLRTARTSCIGLVLPDFANPVYSSIIQGVERRAAERDATVLVHGVDAGRADDYRRLTREARVDGLLFGAISRGSHVLDELNDTRCPYVLINRTAPDAPASVIFDDAAAARLATRYLADLGHRRIAYVGGPAEIDTANRRLRGFESIMAELELPLSPAHVVEGADPLQARHSTATLFSERSDAAPTAIVVWTTMAALGVVSEIHSLGRRIPEDVSIVSLQETWLDAHAWPPLTTVAMPLHEMGARAVDLLLAVVDGGAPETVVLTSPPPRLVERASCARPRGASR